jgi:D-beta-D-heptose 7-phosphate kinase/D-beta-D-heptose 1-phosphate adenosyltransferase
MGKIVDLEQLRRLREDARSEGRKFVLTNGCFDILHRGHVELLGAARSLGDQLAVAVNSDDSVRRLKGRRRPIVGERDRAAVLAALESVDFVVIFDEDTPQRLISALLPDVLVKGADYAADEIVGKDEVEASGGEVVRIPLVGGYSTEKLMKEIAGRYGEASDD